MSIRPSKARKLTEQEVRHLRAKNRESPINAVEAAKMLGVGAETIRRMLRFETWPNTGEGMTETELEPAIEASKEKLARLMAEYKEKDEKGDKLLDELSGIPEEDI